MTTISGVRPTRAGPAPERPIVVQGTASRPRPSPSRVGSELSRTVIVFAVVIIILNLIVDLLYDRFDPKLKQR